MENVKRKHAGCADAIAESLSAGKPDPCNSGWHGRHVKAWRMPGSQGPGAHGEGRYFERPLRDLFIALADYADAHALRYGSALGDDCMLGPAWLDALKAARVLLNGELGRLDGGTLDALAFDMAEAAGFERDALAD